MALDERVAQRADVLLHKFGYGIDSIDLDYLDGALCNYSVRSALVVGFDTEACVLATAYALFDADIFPVIDSRGCDSSGGRDMHDAALRIASRSMRVV